MIMRILRLFQGSACIFVCIAVLPKFVESQDNIVNSSCTSIFRSVRRVGLNMVGRLELPVDEQYPKFNLRLKFSRSIHHMTVRQLKAKDTGSHTEFILDPMEQESDGMLSIDVFLRLRQFFGPVPRLNRIIYNNRVICGGPPDSSEGNEFFMIKLSTSSTTRSVPIFTTKKSSNELEEEEGDVF